MDQVVNAAILNQEYLFVFTTFKKKQASSLNEYDLMCVSVFLGCPLVTPTE